MDWGVENEAINQIVMSANGVFSWIAGVEDFIQVIAGIILGVLAFLVFLVGVFQLSIVDTAWIYLPIGNSPPIIHAFLYLLGLAFVPIASGPIRWATRWFEIHSPSKEDDQQDNQVIDDENSGQKTDEIEESLGKGHDRITEKTES